MINVLLILDVTRLVKLSNLAIYSNNSFRSNMMVWCWQASWKKFLIDMMYLRGHVTLYPNFPNQTSFSTNHMEPGVHIAAADNVVTHHKEDFEVPLLQVYFPLLYPISYKLNSNFCLLEKAFLHIQFGVTVV